MPLVSAYERQLIQTALRSEQRDLDPNTALVLIPDTPEHRHVCEAAIWPALQANGFRKLKGVTPFTSDSWLSDAARWVQGAHVIIADVTGRNPDLMYVLGLCHGLGRYPLMISQDPMDLPFTLRSLHCIAYASHSYGLWYLREDLARELRVFVAGIESPEPPQQPS